MKISFALNLLLCLSTLAGESAAQSLFAFDFGIRGGSVVTESHRLVRGCCGVASVLSGSFALDLERLRGTIGPTVGVVLHDRAEVRFEAVRRQFSYRIENERTGGPGFFRHDVATTRGHFWQFPLLATYRPGQGPTRAFVGGGIDMGAMGKFTTDSQFTSTVQVPATSPPITTTTTTREERKASVPTAFYIIGGVDALVSRISIRPEIRYQRFTGLQTRSTVTMAQLKANQFEFLIGLSIRVPGAYR
jgi:hypothetical protein